MKNRKTMGNKVRQLEQIVNGDGRIGGVTTELGNLQRENKFDSKEPEKPISQRGVLNVKR